jgi:superoxide dismutase, Cu-Zn family
MRKPLLFGSLGISMLAFIAAAVLLLWVSPWPLTASGDDGAKAHLKNASGNPIGVAKFSQEEDGVLIRVSVYNLPAGFHGSHVHANGECTPPDFTSAGGHFNPTGHSHPEHAADLPVLLVKADGKGEARVKTDRFAVADLSDADGSALIIHANPDNYANIPSRYGTPDETTLKTGDAGARIACGVIE